MNKNKKIIYISVIVVVLIIICIFVYGIIEKNALKNELKSNKQFIETVEKNTDNIVSEQEKQMEKFTVSLVNANGLVMYEKLSTKNAKTYLKAADIDFFSEILANWLPTNIDSGAEGTHNGRNYIAYTFYVENIGQTTTNYTTTLEIDEVLEELDEVIRIMVIKNGNKTIYAKKNLNTGSAEPDTTPFYNQDIVMVEKTENFNVNDIDKYTVVIWAEGDDPETLNNLAASGDIKIHMNLTEN